MKPLDEKALEAAVDAYTIFDCASDVDHVRKIIRAYMAALDPAEDVEYEVWQRGEPAASSTDYNDALHYLAMYSQDGPVELYKLVRTPMPLPAAPMSQER